MAADAAVGRWALDAAMVPRAAAAVVDPTHQAAAAADRVSPH